jgi:hypothetical protein
MTGPVDAAPALPVAPATPSAPGGPAALVVVLLTHDCVHTVGRTIDALAPLQAPVLAVDSGSTDGTLALLAARGVQVVHRPFLHYAEQRNWAIDWAAGCRPSRWQLHLDADEVMDARLCRAIAAALQQPGAVQGFLLERRTCFLGRTLRFGGTTSHHLRLFRAGSARCEARLYDQHFVGTGATRRLPGHLLDLNVGDLATWTARHNRWSTLEAAELSRPGPAPGQLPARLSGDPRQRRRLYKRGYYAAPPLLRPLLLFAWRYFAQLGLLDGRAGFLYAFLQALWFRMLVDAKLLEASGSAPGPRP